MLQLRLGLILALVLGLLAGCGGGKSTTSAQVSGKVTYKGQPVKGGDLAFHSKDQGVSRTFLKEDGTYVLPNAPTGPMKVTVDTEFLNQSAQKAAYPGMQGKGPMMDPSKMAGGAPAKSSTGEYVKIPAKYSNPDTTTLTVTLEPGKNTKDFPLED